MKMIWVLCVVSCAPTPTRILLPDMEGDALVWRECPFDPRLSPVTLSSEALICHADEALRFDPGVSSCRLNDIECDAPVADIRAAFTGHAPAAEIFRDGPLLLPADAPTAVTAAAMLILQEAHDHFTALGFAPRQPLLVLASPRIGGAYGVFLPKGDNVFYVQPFDGLMLMPSYASKPLPLAANRGVLFHEYWHRVFADGAYAGNVLRLPGKEGEDTDYAFNRLRGLDEGIADFFGTLGAGRPDYFLASRLQDRRLDAPKVLPAEWRDGKLPRTSDDTFNPYPPGEVFAHSLWRMQQDIAADMLLAAWMAVLPDLRATLSSTPTRLTYAEMWRLFLRQLADDAAACAVLKGTFASALPEQCRP